MTRADSERWPDSGYTLKLQSLKQDFQRNWTRGMRGGGEGVKILAGQTENNTASPEMWTPCVGRRGVGVRGEIRSLGVCVLRLPCLLDN